MLVCLLSFNQIYDTIVCKFVLFECNQAAEWMALQLAYIVGNKLQMYKWKVKDLLPCKVVKSVTLQLSQYAQYVSLMTLQVRGKLVELQDLLHSFTAFWFWLSSRWS